jgi:Ca-activated chloride channel family protein
VRAPPRSRPVADSASGIHRSLRFSAAGLVTALAIFLISAFPSSVQAQQQKPRQLDRGITWQRDSATGELRAVTKDAKGTQSPPDGASLSSNALQVRTQMVPVTCIVSTAQGEPLPGLRREDFRVFDDGVAQPIAWFDASNQPASVAIVIDASPSVLPDSGEMRRAADALIDALAPLDQAAVVDFSAHTYLQLPFSDVREVIRRAVARVNVRDLLGDTGGSNIYEAVYLAATQLFPGRTGRKAIVLLTDGEDSGLGLSFDPASAAPVPGQPENRLTFDDVARALASQDIQIFAVSTETRPRVMTAGWLEQHEVASLISPAARTLGIPPYTLYLAELVRRAGGQLNFLHEAETMADTFRQIASRIRAEYTVGFYPAHDAPSAATSADAGSGWHSLRVEVVDQPGAQVSHRAAYYVPNTQ